jgi:hypothetical protein
MRMAMVQATPITASNVTTSPEPGRRNSAGAAPLPEPLVNPEGALEPPELPGGVSESLEWIPLVVLPVRFVVEFPTVLLDVVLCPWPVVFPSVSFEPLPFPEGGGLVNGISWTMPTPYPAMVRCTGAERLAPSSGVTEAAIRCARPGRTVPCTNGCRAASRPSSGRNPPAFGG